MDFINKKHCPLLLAVRFLDIDCNGDVACTASAGAQFSQFFEFFEFVKSVSVLTQVHTDRRDRIFTEAIATSEIAKHRGPL